MSVLIIELFTEEIHKMGMILPPTDIDSELHDWLQSFDGIDVKISDKGMFYCLKEESSMQLSSNKRRCTSPLKASIRKTPQRRSAFQPLFHKNVPAKETSQKISRKQAPGPSQEKGLLFATQTPNRPTANLESSKVTSTAIKAQKNTIIAAPPQEYCVRIFYEVCFL